MELIEPRFEIIEQGYLTLQSMYEHVERCARVCYRSEGIIHPGSAKPFVEGLIRSGHLSTLEHATVYLIIPEINEVSLFYMRNKFSKCTSYEGKYYVTTNLRVLCENGRESDLQFVSLPTCYHSRRITVRFNSDIHFYKDITRHRLMSYCIESTRYCNYLKEKFGMSIKFTIPCWLEDGDREEFEKDLHTIESIYFKWLDRGWKTEEAAYFLIQGTSADIIMTGFVEDWFHVFSLRADKHAHKTVQELMYPLRDKFVELGYGDARIIGYGDDRFK